MEIKLKDNKKIGFFDLKCGDVFLYKRVDVDEYIYTGMCVKNPFTNKPMIVDLNTGNAVAPFKNFPIESYEIIRVLECELVEK